jgi:hypothetical protein
MIINIIVVGKFKEKYWEEAEKNISNVFQLGLKSIF